MGKSIIENDSVPRNRSPGSTAIVYHYFAHYRNPVLEHLIQTWKSSGGKLTLISDVESNDPSIQLIDEESISKGMAVNGFKRLIVKNFWITKNILWQRGIIGFVLGCDHDCLIFLGSPYFLTTWIGAFIGRIRGKRVLFWTHGITHSEPRIMRFFRKSFFNLAHGLLLYGTHARVLLGESYGVDSKKMFVIFNSLDYDRQVELRNRITPEDLKSIRLELFSGSPSIPILVSVCRLTEEKKLHILFHAVQRLENAGKLVNLLIVGDGDSRKQLSRLATELGIKGAVNFVGSCYDEARLALLISCSDLCVVPGALGLTAMHSLAYGTPVISNDDMEGQGPEIEAIIPGFNGDLFQAESAEELESTISSWLNKSRSRQTVRRNCFFVVDQYYNPKIQAQLIYNAVVGVESSEILIQRPSG